MVLKLEIELHYLPDWFIKEYPAYIPFPPVHYTDLEGKVIVWGIYRNERIPLLSVAEGAVRTQYDWDRWKAYILGEKYRRVVRPLYTRLPFHYHKIPENLRVIAAKLVHSKRSSITLPKTDFPCFPIEQGFEVLQYIYKFVFFHIKGVSHFPKGPFGHTQPVLRDMQQNSFFFLT